MIAIDSRRRCGRTRLMISFHTVRMRKIVFLLQFFTMLLLWPFPICTSFSPQYSQQSKMIRRASPLYRELDLQKWNRQTHRTISQTGLASSLLSLASSIKLSSALTTAITAPIDAEAIARCLGYLVGLGAVLLYTPIAIRIIRQQNANGLTLSTWWLKLLSYTCSIVYNFDRGYPLSTYAETVILSAESLSVLVLVAYYKRELFTAQFFGLAVAFGIVVSVALNDSITPPEVLAIGQAGSAVVNVLALVPQFALNARTQTAGDYSPITASLATIGCTIRLFTTVQLADSDILLLGSYGLAFVLNSSLLAQIMYYGVRYEDRSLVDILTSDYAVINDDSSY